AALASTVATGALSTAASSSSATFSAAKLLSMVKTKTAAAGALLILVAVVAVWRHVPAKRAGAAQTAQAQRAVPADAVAGAGDSAENNSAVLVPTPTNVAVSSPMALQLVEAETGRPLPRAKLHLFYLLEDGRGKVLKAVTDANGKLGVDLPQSPSRALNLFVTAEGHV